MTVKPSRGVSHWLPDQTIPYRNPPYATIPELTVTNRA